MPLFKIMSFVIFAWLSALWCVLILFYSSMDWHVGHPLSSLQAQGTVQFQDADAGSIRHAFHVQDVAPVRHAE